VLTGRSDLVQRVQEMWLIVLPSLVLPERWPQLRELPRQMAAEWG